MARSDYDHWNEEADTMWWAEEGRFNGQQEFDEYDPDDYLPHDDDCCEEEEDDEDLLAMKKLTPRNRVNAFGQKLRPGAPELPGDYWLDNSQDEEF